MSNFIRFSLFTFDASLFSKFGESMIKSLKELNRSLDREELSHKKQV